MPDAAVEPAEEIVVVASRTDAALDTLPLAVTVRELSPLDPAGPGVSLAEQVVTVPGLSIRDRYNAAQGPRISIRGFGARSAFGVRGVTVLLDGIPLTLADGLAQVDLVDPDLVGRVEVLRGPAGALYGNGSGGVLALQTAGGDERTGEDVAVRAGQYGFTKVVARAAEVVPQGGLAVAATRTTFGGFRDHAASERWIVHGAGRLDLTDHTEIGVVATLVDAPTSEDPGALTLEEMETDPGAAAPDNITYDAGEELVQVQGGIRVLSRVTANETLEGSAYATARSYVGRVPFRVNELDRQAQGASLSIRSARDVWKRPIRAALAADVARLADRRSGYDSDGGAATGAPTLHQDEEVDSLGTYTQLELEPVPRLTLLGGARYDVSTFRLVDRLLDDGDDGDRRQFGALTGMAGASVSITWIRSSDSLVT
jgi:iron complex outermembrane recepter protein